jgi:cytochrome c peroxidase
MFKTPTLRNVAARRVFFHSGRFHTLREAVRFYAERDTLQRAGIRSIRGCVDAYDHGDPPALDQAEVDDIVAFLSTLTDSDVEPR